MNTPYMQSRIDQAQALLASADEVVVNGKDNTKGWKRDGKLIAYVSQDHAGMCLTVFLPDKVLELTTTFAAAAMAAAMKN